MENFVALQRWLYGGMASGLGDIADGETRAIVAAMAAAATSRLMSVAGT